MRGFFLLGLSVYASMIVIYGDWLWLGSALELGLSADWALESGIEIMIRIVFSPGVLG